MAGDDVLVGADDVLARADDVREWTEGDELLGELAATAQIV